MYDFIGGQFDGIQLGKEECELRYMLMRLNAQTAKAEQDQFMYRGQALEFRAMGRLAWKEAALLRKKAREMFNARKPDAQHVH